LIIISPAGMNSEGWSLKSLPVTTALTPASFCAAEVSIDLMRACACGLLQHLADDLAGHDQVGAEPGAARHLVDAVRPIGRVPTHLNSEPARLSPSLACQAPLISAAASITARTILS
jgi:hypothetical protein